MGIRFYSEYGPKGKDVWQTISPRNCTLFELLDYITIHYKPYVQEQARIVGGNHPAKVRIWIIERD